jgi:hypothetical protein
MDPDDMSNISTMPIEVDTSEAPAFLRYRFTGPYPSVEEQALVRDRLIAGGHLTRDTVALMDARQLEAVPDDDVLARTVAAALQRGGWPRRRAYLIDPVRHAHMIEQFKQLAMTSVTTAAFTDEHDALAWLKGDPR